MINRLLLRLILWPSAFWTHHGADVPQLRIILETKFKLAARSKIIFGLTDKQKLKTGVFGFLRSLMLIVIGAGLLFPFLSLDNQFTAWILYFFQYMTILSLILFLSYINLLLDTKDYYILLPKPISDRTLILSRVLQTGIAITSIGFLLALPGLIYTAIMHGMGAAALFLLQTCLAGLISVLTANGCYLLFIRTMQPQTLKKMLSVVQSTLSGLAFILVYIGPSLYKAHWLQNLVIIETPWLWILPPVWIAAMQIWLQAPASLLMAGLSLPALLMPFVSIWLISRLLTKDFRSRLVILAEGHSPTVQKEKVNNSHPIDVRLASHCTGSTVENAGFRITWLLTTRSRAFKQKFYSSLVSIPAIFLVSFLLGGNNKEAGYTLATKVTRLEDIHGYLFLLYFALYPLMNVLLFVMQHERYKAAWVYHTAPIQQPGEIFSGMLKAILIKYFLPVHLGCLLIFIPLFSAGVINDILLSAAYGSISLTLITLFTTRYYPFSIAEKNTNSTIKGAKLVLTYAFFMGLIGLMGLLHFFMAHYEAVVWLSAGCLWVISFFMLRKLRKENWSILIIHS